MASTCLPPPTPSKPALVNPCLPQSRPPSSRPLLCFAATITPKPNQCPRRALTPCKPLSASAKPPPSGGRSDQKQGRMLPLPSHTQLVHRFYSSINEKDLIRLEKLLSTDCIFEDSSYSTPMQGKSINRFFKDLTRAMGKHVRFVIDGVYEGKELTTAVMWHLEWSNQTIPLTKGCSLFKCARDGELLLIKEARVFTESLVKPGDFLLRIMRIFIWLFDWFPILTRRFLRRPEVAFRYIGWIRNILWNLTILPFLAYYANRLLHHGRARGLALKLLENVKQKVIAQLFIIVGIILQKIWRLPHS